MTSLLIVLALGLLCMVLWALYALVAYALQTPMPLLGDDEP